MDSTRIAELLQPFFAPSATASPLGSHAALSAARAREESASLSAEQLSRILMYIDILLRWNARINLTAIRQPEEIVTRHFGESLFLARHLFPRVAHLSPFSGNGESGNQQPITEEFLIDLGSGAGFPGLPIKIWAPYVRVMLIESNQKKVAFLREVIRQLTLTDINVLAGRAEDCVSASASIVTLRAVEHFADAAVAAISLLAPGGRLALLISEAQLPIVEDLVHDVDWSMPVPIPLSSRRILLVGTLNPKGETA